MLALLQLQHLEDAYNVDVANERSRSRRDNMTLRQAISSLSENKFKKRYRLSKQLFMELANDLRPYIPTPRRSDGLDVDTKILIALSFFATGSYQTPVGDSNIHAVSQASVSKALAQVTSALNKPKIMSKYIRFPLRRSEREIIKRRFYDTTNMHGLLGCVDGSHVAIVTPAEHEERFINRKGFHSLNVLIMCDADLNIMCVDPSYPGSTHDSKVWDGNPVKTYVQQLFENGEDVYLLGDSGYPLREIMMTPILNAQIGTPEAYYTSVQTTARSIVERCIGVLKARFRCLLVDRKLHYKPAVAARMVNACCVLHNIAHAAGIEYEPLTNEELRRERALMERASFHALNEGAAARNAQSQQLHAGRVRRDALVRRLWRQRN